MHLEGYAGMGEEASRALLERIMLPGASGDAVLEHVCAQPSSPPAHWLGSGFSDAAANSAGQRGDLVLWDNRRLLHSTMPWVDVPHLLHQVFLRTRTPMLPPPPLRQGKL